MGNQSSNSSSRSRSNLTAASNKGVQPPLKQSPEDARLLEEKKASTLHRKGLAFLETHMWEQAEQAFRESLELRDMLGQKEGRDYAVTLHYLAVAQGKLGDEGASKRFRESFKRLDTFGGAEISPFRGVALANEARHLCAIRDMAGAMRLFQDAMGILDKVEDPGSSAAYWDCFRDWVDCCCLVEPSKALDLCSRFSASPFWKSDNTWRGRALISHARVAFALKDKAEALRLLDEAETALLAHDPTQVAEWQSRKRNKPYLDELTTFKEAISKE